jgi:DNA repair photolyase
MIVREVQAKTVLSRSKVFEPRSSAIDERIEALERLHSEGLKTFAMIAPLLPQAEGLASQLRGKVDYVLVDKMNYHHADWVYRKFGLEYAMSRSLFDSKKKDLVGAFEKEGICCQVLF